VPLTRFREILKSAVGGASHTYAIVAGGLTAIAFPSLNEDCTAVFGVAPVATGYTASFVINTSTMTALAINAQANMPNSWEQAGTAIDYTALTKVAKPRAVESTCIVM